MPMDHNDSFMNGLELLARLKAAHWDSIIEAAIVMLTSSNSQNDYEQVAHYGFKGIMQKPLTEDKLPSLVTLFSGGNQGY